MEIFVKDGASTASLDAVGALVAGLRTSPPPRRRSLHPLTSCARERMPVEMLFEVDRRIVSGWSAIRKIRNSRERQPWSARLNGSPLGSCGLPPGLKQLPPPLVPRIPRIPDLEPLLAHR